MNIRVIKRDERDLRKEYETEVPKTAERAKRDAARRTIVTVNAWVGELRHKRQAETTRALRIVREVA